MAKLHPGIWGRALKQDQGTGESLETRPGYRGEPWNETRVQERALERDQDTGESFGTRPRHKTRVQEKRLINLMEYEIV